MDGGVAPAPVPAGLPRHAGRTLSSTGTTGLTAASTVLLLLYLAGRFIWAYKMEAAATTAGAPASPSIRAAVVARPHGRRAVPLSLLPVFVQGKDHGALDLECAVCLSEFGEREAGRLLPGCGHGFHEACIVTWLQLNSTCPLCRAAVDSPP